MLVSGDARGELQLDGRSVTNARSGIDALAALPSGGIVATDAELHLRMFDASGALRAELAIPARADGRLEVWDARHGRMLWTLPAHRSYVVGVRVDGDSVVTRSFSGEVARWTLPEPRQVIRTCDVSEITGTGPGKCGTVEP